MLGGASMPPNDYTCRPSGLLQGGEHSVILTSHRCPLYNEQENVTSACHMRRYPWEQLSFSRSRRAVQENRGTLCASVNVCRPYVLSSTSRSNHAGQRQNDASMHDRPFIGIEGLPLTEHGRHLCTLASTKSWHGLYQRIQEPVQTNILKVAEDRCPRYTPHQQSPSWKIGER